MFKMETTSEEEIQAYNMVLDIVRDRVAPERISRSSARSYMALVLDNNPHRTICRLYLKGNKKILGTISERKVETRNPINSIDEIARYSGDILNTIRAYDR